MVKTFVNGVVLPINPFDSVSLESKNNNKRIEIVELGEVSMLGSRGLYSITINSLFSDNVYPWSVCENPKAAKFYVDFIRSLQEEKKPIRFVITGDGLDINMPCSIESFKTTQEAGETNEYYYTLALSEYREYSVTKLEIIPDALKRRKTQVLSVTTENKPAPKTYTVKKGDCLYAIAQSFYQDGNQYPKIYTANQAMMDAYNNKHGMPKYTIYAGWSLVIP